MKAQESSLPMSEFIGEEVQVHFAQKPGPPTWFEWRGKEYRIEEVEQQWLALDLRQRWWQRRHRDYYLVRCDTGERFELYFNRGPGRKYWVLRKRVG